MINVCDLDNLEEGYITNLLNLSVMIQVIPNIWKLGRTIPIPKPGKRVKPGISHRPVTIKLLEKCLLPTITDNVTTTDHQHGLRKSHTTTKALQLIHHQLQSGPTKEL